MTLSEDVQCTILQPSQSKKVAGKVIRVKESIFKKGKFISISQLGVLAAFWSWFQEKKHSLTELQGKGLIFLFRLTF